jgi:excisionase family DNA binding protein
MQPKYVSTIQAAKLLQLATGTVQKMVDSGALSGWKTSGGHRRVLLESIEEYIHTRNRQKEIDLKGYNASIGNVKHDKKFIIIEDSHFFAAKLKAFLIENFDNVKIDICYSAFDAINLVSSDTYDAIILDMKMPDFDGFSFFNQLSLNLPNVINSVIILTDLDESQVKEGINSYRIPHILSKSDFENSLYKLAANILK